MLGNTNVSPETKFNTISLFIVHSLLKLHYDHQYSTQVGHDITFMNNIIRTRNGNTSLMTGSYPSVLYCFKLLTHSKKIHNWNKIEAVMALSTRLISINVAVTQAAATTIFIKLIILFILEVTATHSDSLGRRKNFRTIRTLSQLFGRILVFSKLFSLHYFSSNVLCLV